MAATSTAAMPYIGSKISLITNSELRYEGKLVNINTANSTVTLANVKMYGTEQRRQSYIAPSTEVFDYIIFNGKDIKDLTVSEAGFSVKEDPAVVAVNVPPPRTMGGQQMGMPVQQVGGQMMMQQGQPMGQQHMSYGPRAMMGNQHPGYRHAYNPHYTHHMIDSMRGGKQHGSKLVVGELTAQPNTTLKTQVADTFNFEEANSKFQKGTADVQQGPSAPVYDKATSFFDNISCETLNRQQGRSSKVDREKQRELDAETFGSAAAAAARGPRYYRRGLRRGGMRGNRGGMYGGPGGRNMAYNHHMLRVTPPNVPPHIGVPH